eukprot:m.5554 g.5554  ORF g.5554 m.5554 type:complete len:359 (+) comp3331_c0_seq1:193-1269(+)
MATFGTNRPMQGRPTNFVQVQPTKRYGRTTKRAPLSNIGNSGGIKSAKTSVNSHPTISNTTYGGEQEDYTMMSVDETPAVRPKHVPDIDSDHSDPQLVADYAQDIHRYMLQLEDKLKVTSYMQSQAMISIGNRGVLVDWLVEVHHRFNLLPETLYLTCLLIDRFLSKAAVTKSKLQLVGVTGMLLACKYEEMWPPEVADFVYMTDNAYTSKQILNMELTILRALDFNLGNPLPTQFLERYLAATQSTGSEVEKIARYVMELTVTAYHMIEFKPSELAAASICIARSITGENTFSDSLEYYSTYSKEHLQPCINGIQEVLKSSVQPNSAVKAVRRKYRSEQYEFVSQRADLALYISKLG